VVDSGGADNTGAATAFHCTNFSGVNENVRIVVRNFNGVLLFNFYSTILHLSTVAASTKATSVYSTFNMNTGAIHQGTAAIAATSVNVVCTVMQVDAASSTPQGIKLQMIRFNPIPGTQE
jgi:hypothetical protein